MKDHAPNLVAPAGFRPFLLPLLLLAAVSIPSLPIQAQESPPETDAQIPASNEETFTPIEYELDRYEKIRGKSPFEFELAKPPVGESVDPFEGLVLAGFAGSASRPTVYLLNTKSQERVTIVNDPESKKNDTGFKVLSLNRGRTLRTTTVKVEKDGQQKELSFDSAALSNMTGGAGGAAPGQMPPGRPGQPRRPGNVPLQPNVPAVQPFQAPQAFIPPTRNSMQAGQPGQQQPGQPSLQPGQPGQPAMVTNPQQQINTLLRNNPQAVVPGQPARAPGRPPAGNPQPRRRVVLPTPAP